MNDEPTLDNNDPMYEELVAYLDGELDSSSRQQVERRLSEDAQYRQHLHQLQRSWDLLDALPRSQPDESFTQSTVAMVALTAADDVAGRKSSQPLRQQLAWWGGAGGVVASILAGYVFAAALLDGPNRQVLNDLPLIENIDLYRHAESLEFLRALDRERLFPEEAEDEL